MDLRHYLHLLRRNWPVLLVVVALCVGVAVYQDVRQPSVYQASAQILLMPENVVDPNAGATGNRPDASRYGTAQLALITSSKVADPASERVEGVSGVVLRDNVTATIDESSTIITVQATARRPERADAIANAVAETYVEERAEASTGKLTTAIEEIDGRLGELAQALAAFPSDELTADQVAVQQQYQSLFARQQDLRVQLSLQQSTAEILDPAEMPGAPIGLGLPSKVILALLFGGVLGLAAAYAREQLDDRVRSREEVQMLTGLPILAELPVDRARTTSPTYLATVDRPLDPLAEAARSLRTNVGFLGLDRPIRRLAVTSALPGEGKSLVAANLAAAYAQAGHRTVLVSADLRQPSLESVFGVGRTTGLSDACSEVVTTADASSLEALVKGHLVATRVENLDLLPAGTPVPNPSELLSSNRMDELLDALDRAFDMVIVDTSPILSVADAAALSIKVGDVLLVASMPTTRRRTITRMVEAADATHARVLGVALNRVSTSVVSYGGYYERPVAGKPGDAVDGPPYPADRLRYGDSPLRPPGIRNRT